MATEIEIKLTTDAESLAKVQEHPAVAALLHAAPRKSKDVSTYYDTRAGELRQAGVALRMRRSGRRWLQTVKGTGDSVGALHRRPEYEWPVHGARIDVAKLATTPWRDVFAATAGRLRPVFVTDVERTAVPLAFPDGTRATLCLDQGEVRSGRRRAPLVEIEIELIDGELRTLFDLALALAADVPISISQASKAERGYALAAALPRKPVRARKLASAADASLASALAAVGGDCLAQIAANASWPDDDNGEFVHQARVGVRRLRSLLRIVADFSGPESIAPVMPELQWLSTSLGAARDWDVFASETLPSIARAVRQPRARVEVGVLRAHATRTRNAHFGEARAAAASPRTQRLLLSCGALFAALEAASAPSVLRAPARSAAANILDRRARRLRKRGAHLRRVSPVERHHARIAAKKLRYAADVFAPLFATSRVRGYLAALSKLQSRLGYLNDLATGERLLDEIEARTDARRLVHGAGIARGWLAGAETTAVVDAAKTRRKLAKLKPFWR